MLLDDKSVSIHYLSSFFYLIFYLERSSKKWQKKKTDGTLILEIRAIQIKSAKPAIQILYMKSSPDPK